MMKFSSHLLAREEKQNPCPQTQKSHYKSESPGSDPKTISSSAQYVTLPKIFFTSKLVIYFVPTLPIELKRGQQISGGLLIANHMDESL
jgi:hypothetical protein